jgi:hypothetical protein
MNQDPTPASRVLKPHVLKLEMEYRTEALRAALS